ncbi:hypothetical protein Ddye_026763 [Dipteronia dyeriana]|uniref:Membrane-associated kinase regulator 1 n=1 Tax=Dipteronia dyeriana TaxID=168575 RepID=A0AAD9TNA7_9ROSI|nr:hypothetical protein Ddye_026763 [Dipteronia dyeriana]
MENRRKRSSSGEMFSFPSTPNQDSDFEFGCLTPDSPSQDPSRNSPADHLFFNGRLLPHSFPFHQRQQPGSTLHLSPDNISRATTSRTSSVSSKDSLMSSRSNSTNSRSSSSSSSSARTSLSSDNSERRFMYYNNNKVQCRATMASKMVTAQLYGSSQRWQHLTPVPVLKRDASLRQNNGGGGGCGGGVGIKEVSKSKTQQGKKNKNKKIRTSDLHERPKGICRRIFMSFLFACRECHAMEPSTKDDHDHALKKTNEIVIDH